MYVTKRNTATDAVINIALYIQGLIDGSLPMHGFYIHPYSTESTVLANRTILKGAKATNGMRIHITYMKL